MSEMVDEQFSPNGWPVDAEFLHIFAQGSNHDEAFIVGSREGLSLTTDWQAPGNG